MQKDFDSWNSKKKRLHHHHKAPFYHEREIWWCALGTNVGFEQDGTGKQFDRPIVIIRGFNKDTFFCVGLTGKKRTGHYYHFLGSVDGREVSANLSQVRLVDARRLIRKIATLDEKRFAELREKLQDILFGNSLSRRKAGRGRSHK